MKEDFYTNTVDGAAAYQKNFAEREPSPDFDIEPNEEIDDDEIYCGDGNCSICKFRNKCL